MPLHLFERFGVEIEYMLVDAVSLDVLPLTDRLLQAAAGSDHLVADAERGDATWSNELVLHVLEMKTSEPAASLAGLAEKFQQQVRDANTLARPLGGRLLPGGMHPWMQPLEETRLWPHDEKSAVYAAFNRIFDCRGHGWSNLQSMHLNLPFADDEEFGRLHAAIRLILPILPALSAASPIMEGRLTGTLDNRLAVYRTNAARIPSVSGQVVPERAFTREQYEDRILRPIYRDLAPHDPEGTLQEEWVNARGAIARFDRNTIEIRVLDTQECPAADLAIASAIVAVLKTIVEERWTTLAEQQAWEPEPLAGLLTRTIRDADAAQIDDPAYLHALGWCGASACTAGELWRDLCRRLSDETARLAPDCSPVLRFIVEHGPLARRIANAVGSAPAPQRLMAVYRDLADCLETGRVFDPARRVGSAG